MTKHRRQFTKEFKLQVIREVELGKPLAQAGREHELHPNLIRKWQTLFAEHGQSAFAGNGKAYSNEAKIAELERFIGQLTIDITYVRLPREFIYLAVILDVFSRRRIGWALSRHLDAALTLAALQHALAERAADPGLVHHSDRRVQYASHAYTELLADRGIHISMSRRGNPYDNADAESFITTLKYKEVYLNDYETLAEASASIDHFLEEVYNQKRLHSALGYLPPVEFEQPQSSPRDYTT